MRPVGIKPRRPGALRAAAVALALATATLVVAAKPSSKAPAPPPAPPPVEVGDTPANLRAAFTHEMNAKEWYLAAARRAQQEGRFSAMQLFLACAKSEEIHARRHVEAIAVTSGEARAVLDRVAVGGTDDNLRAALERERWSAEVFYPALLERARADRATAAVRSMTYAMSAEREHVRLLEAELQSAEAGVAARTLRVCPTCGKTVEAVDFGRCPVCFTGAAGFVSIT
uniref:Rubrerythrin family protein n=1 Tax=Eiseniibacteriota bacterium TaxID=2212470 RepID=A0A832I911_UNCEI